MRKIVFLALAFAPAAASAAAAYARYAHPRGDYVLEYPSGWKRSLGLGAVELRPPGPAGERVSVTLERYPFGKDSPLTPEDFEKRLRADVGRVKRLDAEGEATAAGRKARKLALTVTAQLKDGGGAPIAPRKELYLILPKEGDGFYVLKFLGLGDAFDKNLPAFERIARHLKIPAPKRKK